MTSSCPGLWLAGAAGLGLPVPAGPALPCGALGVSLRLLEAEMSTVAAAQDVLVVQGAPGLTPETRDPLKLVLACFLGA